MPGPGARGDAGCAHRAPRSRAGRSALKRGRVVPNISGVSNSLDHAAASIVLEPRLVDSCTLVWSAARESSEKMADHRALPLAGARSRYTRRVSMKSVVDAGLVVDCSHGVTDDARLVISVDHRAAMM